VEMSLRKVNLHKKMVEKGFTMVVRDNPIFRKWIAYLMLLLDPSQTVLVYSQYKGYLDEQAKLREFVNMFGSNMAYVHTSGHATKKTLAKVCTLLNPKTAIIPIHKDSGSSFLSLEIADSLKNKVISSSCSLDGIDIDIN
jgi:ribonuclease J